MSRHSVEAKTKPKSSNEVKNIPARRLYRGVLEYARRLENGRQHRRNLMSIFQSEQVGLRHKLRDACEKLMFTYPVEYGRKAEEIIWRKVYYEVIQLVKGNKKFVKSGSRLEILYKEYLLAAIGYYHHLLLKLQAHYHPLIDVDWPFANSPLSEKSHRRRQNAINHNGKQVVQEGEVLTKKRKDEGDERKAIAEWARETCYRLLLCLGDLGRYQIEHGGSRPFAERFYHLALLVKPDSGMPFNQLGTLAGHHTWWGLTAAYYYYRCLETENKFDGADGNLQKLLDRNKKNFYQIPTDALENMINAEEYKKEHTRIFIVSFLYLCDLLRPKTYATDVEITGLCKKLIDALPVCLANSTAAKGEESKENIVSMKENVKPHVKRQNPFPSHHHHHHSGDYTRIQLHIVLKMCVLCIINIRSLQSSRSNRSSAAIAFALAFFSHLLGHVIALLCPVEKSEDEISGNHANQVPEDGEEKDSTPRESGDGDASHANAKDNGGGKKRKNRIRRRRHRGSGDSDLSEGEMASGSDVSDSEDDSGSDSASTSSSNSELSQEEMEDVDSDAKSKGSDESPEKKETPQETIVDNHAGLELANSLANGQSTLASLKDISQKMFQPTVRRRILLAPSFFNNIKPNTQPPRPKDEKSEAKEKIEDSKPEPVPATKQSESSNVDKEITEDVKKGVPDDGTMTNGHAEEEVVGVNGTSENAEADMKTEELDAEKGDSEKSKGQPPMSAEARHKMFQRMMPLQQLFASLKLLCDWLAANEKVTAACAQNSKALWSRLARLANLLPDEDGLLDMGEVSSDDVLQSQIKNLRSVITSSKKWKQKCRLPEDYILSKATGSLVISEDKAKTAISDLSDMQQGTVRVCRIRSLCHSLVHVDGLEMTYNEETKQFEGPEEPSEEDAEVLDIQTVEEMRKTRLMREMAELRLRSEVNVLESQLGTPRTRDASLCLYLVPDALALCHDLTHIRRLLAAERFFIVIPKTVIDGLDGLKKDLQGARDAIRFLETEFKKGNRFIKAQVAEETSRGVPGERPKLRRNDMQAWRFYRIIECCRFLALEEAKKDSEMSHNEISGIVAILTHSTDKATLSQNQINAMNAAETFGIQVFSAMQFSKLWKKLPDKSK